MSLVIYFAACRCRYIRVLEWPKDVGKFHPPLHVNVATQSALRAILSESDYQTPSTLPGTAPCQRLSRLTSERIAGRGSYVRQPYVCVAWIGANGIRDIVPPAHRSLQFPRPHLRYGRYASLAQPLDFGLCCRFLHPRLGTGANRHRIQENHMVLEK